MSKIQVIGPRGLLLQVLETIRESGVLHIDADIKATIYKAVEPRLKPVMLEGEALAERLFFEDLRSKIDRLLALLPKLAARETYLSLPQAIDSIADLLPKHLDTCEQKSQRREVLRRERSELGGYLVFLRAAESLVPKGAEAVDLEFIGVEVVDPAALEHLGKVVDRVMPGTELRTAKAENGSYIALLTTEKPLSQHLKDSLRDNQIPEVSLPGYLEGLTLSEKVRTAQARYEANTAEASAIDQELWSFAQAWCGRYQAVREWLEDRLSLLKASASLYETDTCFLLFGWIPSADLPALKNTLARKYGDAAVVEEKELLKQDLNRVPVALRNPPYFQPFELLIKLLPLPRYTSLDPTPFIAIFFPLFFGMILGDSGYGLILLLLALGLIFLVRQKPMVQQAGKILLVASIYTIIFGLLYGECFGQFGTEVLGLDTMCIDRRVSIMPMLYFSLAMGSVHVILGLVLGFLSALRGKETKEAVFKLFSIFLVVCLIGILISFFAPVSALFRKPLIIASLIIAPVLLLTGGLLAPFEMLRHLGNIISYVRIMAIGLTSVLLAYVANNLAGAAGSIWIGVIVALLLHTFNILLGVFAPTLHALRLHYVEFFSKFLQPGGKAYKPLRKGE